MQTGQSLCLLLIPFVCSKAFHVDSCRWRVIQTLVCLTNLRVWHACIWCFGLWQPPHQKMHRRTAESLRRTYSNFSQNKSMPKNSSSALEQAMQHVIEHTHTDTHTDTHAGTHALTLFALLNVVQLQQQLATKSYIPRQEGTLGPCLCWHAAARCPGLLHRCRSPLLSLLHSTPGHYAPPSPHARLQGRARALAECDIYANNHEELSFYNRPIIVK